VVYGRGDARPTRANPYLLLFGIGSMVVATFGLFLRASPTLSGVFLVVGATLLVLAVFEPEPKPRRAPTSSTSLDLASLDQEDRATATAEARKR
jgi:hypothetical protein